VDGWNMSKNNSKTHWNHIYASNPEETLGWYESDAAPTLKLLETVSLPDKARIFIAGAGSTRLVDQLLGLGYQHLIVSDISDQALQQLKQRLGERAGQLQWIIDDLTRPSALYDIEPVDLWIDRAVLHFFTAERDQDQYFNLLRSMVSSGGFVILAEFSLDGASRCSGLDVKRYDIQALQEGLGHEFNLVESFNYMYTMPNADKRPYLYSLFHRVVNPA